MVKPALALIVVTLLTTACMASRTQEPSRPAGALIATSHAPVTPDGPTAVPTPSATAVTVMTPTVQTPQPPAPTPTPFSQVLSEVRTPTLLPPAIATPVRGGTTLQLPEGTSVAWGGCASDGECEWYNFYWAPTHEAVLQNGESQIKVEHELCHAHQHWSINGGAPLDPSRYNLSDWYSTSEGRSFAAAVDGLPWPWSQSAVNNLEDFAWTCAYWYVQPDFLLRVSPQRYDWAAANLP